jgi:hypothetical protein
MEVLEQRREEMLREATRASGLLRKSFRTKNVG